MKNHLLLLYFYMQLKKSCKHTPAGPQNLGPYNHLLFFLYELQPYMLQCLQRRILQHPWPAIPHHPLNQLSPHRRIAVSLALAAKGLMLHVRTFSNPLLHISKKLLALRTELSHSPGSIFLPVHIMAVYLQHLPGGSHLMLSFVLKLLSIHSHNHTLIPVNTQKTSCNFLVIIVTKKALFVIKEDLF